MPRQQIRAADRAQAKKAKQTKPKSTTTKPALNAPVEWKIEDLDDRQISGVARFEELQKNPKLRMVLNEEERMYRAQSSLRDSEAETWYHLKRLFRNNRGKMEMEYTCGCPDQKKHARRDCAHRFCEKMIDGVVKVIGTLTAAMRKKVQATRRPARLRTAHDGRSVRTTQRAARVRMPIEIPRLILSLRKAWDAEHPDAMAMRHGRLTADAVRAAVLLLKVAEGKSADAMISRYQELIENRRIGLTGC